MKIKMKTTSEIVTFRHDSEYGHGIVHIHLCVQSKRSLVNCHRTPRAVVQRCSHDVSRGAWGSGTRVWVWGWCHVVGVWGTGYGGRGYWLYWAVIGCIWQLLAVLGRYWL